MSEHPRALESRDLLRAAALWSAGIAATLLIAVLVWLWVVEVFAGGQASLVPQVSALVSVGLVVAVVASWLTGFLSRGRLAATERALADEQRSGESSRQLLQAVLDHVPVGVFVVDSKRVIRHANDRVHGIHGVEHLIGTACVDSLGGGGADCDGCPLPKALAEGAPAVSEGYERDRRTGEVILRTSHPLQIDGVNSALVIESVVTEQQRLQATLLHQEKMAAYGLLAAGIAHDMGNPLASIDMHLQLLQAHELPEKAAASTRVVRKEAERLRRSLRELVEFARRRGTERALVSVQAVLADTLKLVRYDSRMRNVEVVQDWDPNTPGVSIIEDHLIQIVLNLLLNALDAMPDGGQLTTELQQIGDEVVLRVRDTGVGMEPATLKRCCEPLFTTKPEGKGTGLGMAIGRDIAREAGGNLEAHSALGKGTTVIVRLPAAVRGVVPGLLPTDSTARA